MLKWIGGRLSRLNMTCTHDDAFCNGHKSLPVRICINYRYAIVLLAIILFAGMVRYRLLDVPFERDEGEYAYAGQLMLRGIPPYENLYNMKLPGTYAAYAAILAVFGQTHRGVHAGLLVVNIATIIALYLLTKRLFGRTAGAVAAACYALLSVALSVQGVFAHAEHFVMLPVLIGLLVLLSAEEKDDLRRYFLGGIFLGIGVIMKQHGAAFVIFGALYTLFSRSPENSRGWKRPITRSTVFTVGACMPYALTCLVLALTGVFGKFWYWTVSYALRYSTMMPLAGAFESFAGKSLSIVKSFPLLWILVLIGLTILLWCEPARKRRLFILLFVLFSLLSICPGLYFRRHYYVMTLPAAAMLAGAGIVCFRDLLSRIRFGLVLGTIPVILAVASILVSIYIQKEYLFRMTPHQVCRAAYGDNPFPESLEIGRFIRENTSEDDRIAVLGSEPQIYFYSGRRSATGYVYMYPLMENHDLALDMQKEMIAEIESNSPKYIVYIQHTSSWLTAEDSHDALITWFDRYCKSYKVTGVVEVIREGSQYYWGKDVIWPARTPTWIVVLERKEVKKGVNTGIRYRPRRI